MIKYMNPRHYSYTSCFAVAFMLILVLVSAAGCIRDPNKEYGGRGEYMSIGAHIPEMLDAVVYTVQGETYMISPQEEGMSIAAVRTRAVNRNSTHVTISVDEDTAMLRSENGDEFKPFEPSKRAVKTSETAPKDNPYISHLWGQYTVIQNYEIAGWFFFEVPHGSAFTEFSWDDLEFIRVIYRY